MKLGAFTFIHVVVVLRNVQRSLMLVHSCCFANINLLLLCRSRCRRRRRCLSSLKRWPGSEGGTTITAEYVFLFLMSTDRHVLFVWLALGSVTLLPVATFPHVKGASFSYSIYLPSHPFQRALVASGQPMIWLHAFHRALIFLYIYKNKTSWMFLIFYFFCREQEALRTRNWTRKFENLNRGTKNQLAAFWREQTFTWV